MKRLLSAALAMAWAAVVAAAPLRVAVLDFDDRTGLKPDALLGGEIQTRAIVEKGALLLGEKLVNQPNFVLVDRRDFIAQVEKLQPKDMGDKTPTRPSFIQAAQAIRADAVLRGSLLALSTGKQSVNLGGNQTEMSTLSARVAIEALDARDGAVIAMANGKAEKTFRQTAQVKTVLSENEVLLLVEEAIGKALPSVEKALREKQAAQQERPTVKVSVKTTADPALVEIDGILVGSTPLERFETYKGDHVLSIGKPGYQQITKRILLDKDMMIEAPMLKVQLSADELKEVLEKMRMNVVVGEPALVITPLH
jgi:hypothetical protein